MKPVDYRQRLTAVSLRLAVAANKAIFSAPHGRKEYVKPPVRSPKSAYRLLTGIILHGCMIGTPDANAIQLPWQIMQVGGNAVRGRLYWSWEWRCGSRVVCLRMGFEKHVRIDVVTLAAANVFHMGQCGYERVRGWWM